MEKYIIHIYNSRILKLICFKNNNCNIIEKHEYDNC